MFQFEAMGFGVWRTHHNFTRWSNAAEVDWFYRGSAEDWQRQSTVVKWHFGLDTLWWGASIKKKIGSTGKSNSQCCYLKFHQGWLQKLQMTSEQQLFVRIKIIKFPSCFQREVVLGGFYVLISFIYSMLFHGITISVFKATFFLNHLSLKIKPKYL